MKPESVNHSELLSRWPLPAAVALLLLGFLFGATFIVYAGIAMTALVLVNRYLATKWSESLVLERQLIADEIQVGESVQVGVTIKNKGPWFIPWMLIEDVVSKRAVNLPPKALRVDGSSLRLVMMGPKRQLLLSYRLTALRRGYYQIGPTVLETGDLFGLHRKYRVATDPQYVLVLPKLVPLVTYEVGSRRPIGEIRVSYRSMEDPSLMAGIRDYRVGDPLNRIHWKATARTGKLQTKIHQPTTMAGATLLLDMHDRSNPLRNEPVRTDLAVTAASAIAHALYHMQQPFGLISNGRDAADHVRVEGWEADFRSREALQAAMRDDVEDTRLRPVVLSPGRGPEHFFELHRTLARLERSDGLELGDLILETQSRMPRTLSIIAILQSVDDRNAMALGMLVRQGYSITVIANCYDATDARDLAGKLSNYRIPVHRLRDEASIPYVCQAGLFGFTESDEESSPLASLG
jgi:uncharacterized protein (DUF58 family)